MALTEGIIVLALGLGNATGVALFNDHNFTPIYILSLIIAMISLAMTFFLYFDDDPIYAPKVTKNSNNFNFLKDLPFQKYLQMFNPKNMVHTLIQPFRESFSNNIFWLPFVLFFFIDIISRGEMWVDLSYVKNEFNLSEQFDTFTTFWIEFYAIYVLWSFVALVIIVPVMSKVLIKLEVALDERPYLCHFQLLDVSDTYVLFLCGCGTFLHSFVFLVAKHYQTLYAVCILDMFNLSGLISIRSMISKLVSKQNTGKAFAVLAIVESLVEGLSAEYYWIYTATSGTFFLKKN